MLVVTAGNNRYDYKKTILHCDAACDRFGYGMIIYDLGGLGFGRPVDHPRCTTQNRHVTAGLKPSLILDAMDHAEPNELVAWIDGDATLITPIDELEEDTFDVGVTVRPKVNRRKTSYVNAGVFFVRNNKEGRGFMQHWVSRMPENPTDHRKGKCHTDQSVLEDMLLSSIDVIPWDAFNTTHVVEGATLKILECAVYNNMRVHEPATREPPGFARILHFRNHTMNRLDAYVEDYL